MASLFQKNGQTISKQIEEMLHEVNDRSHGSELHGINEYPYILIIVRKRAEARFDIQPALPGEAGGRNGRVSLLPVC